jgi:hypothetical protein
MRRHLAFLCVAVLAVAFVAHIWAQPPTGRPTGRSTSGFQGYWMGVDQLTAETRAAASSNKPTENTR